MDKEDKNLTEKELRLLVLCGAIFLIFSVAFINVVLLPNIQGNFQQIIETK